MPPHKLLDLKDGKDRYAGRNYWDPLHDSDWSCLKETLHDRRISK